ncbi:FecR family protein [Aquicella lusitana]|uniref:FecR family protein n=1 Tax=Aquicella lusitana TaxID=254246 RepID=A0A370GHA4_9COXI|nr:FecR family protein [Aquicella lusitana]RDI41303.1 FecR family protein [Aquicella lusitana]VVC72330.1 hypothetical protein AQULUS_00400 [Aquicella lusitana]
MIMINFQKMGIALIALLFLSFIQPAFAEDPPLPTPVGRVIWVQGTLKAIMPNQEERLLKKTSVIYLNDTLITDSKSKAQIAFTDNTLMTFRPDTKFYIDKYQYNPKAKKGSVGKYIMNLIEGGFRTITGLIAKGNPSDYKVNTPVATIGVRGTDYTVYVNPKGQLYVGYYSGSPCVDSKKGSLCLSEKTKYAYVPTSGAVPVPLSQQPAVFHEKLDIVPTKITPFSAVGGGVTTAGTAVGTTGTSTPPARSGTVSSFCITN